MPLSLRIQATLGGTARSVGRDGAQCRGEGHRLLLSWRRCPKLVDRRVDLADHCGQLAQVGADGVEPDVEAVGSFSLDPVELVEPVDVVKRGDVAHGRHR
jgi:hypothetical protein